MLVKRENLTKKLLIMKVLNLHHLNDLIIISDVDEIPNLEIIILKIKNKIILFKQNFFIINLILKLDNYILVWI